MITTVLVAVMIPVTGASRLGYDPPRWRWEIAPEDYGIDAVYVTMPLSAVVPPYVPAGSAFEFA